jgi:diacylglycerol O-acyltransferase / wax synthase
VPAVHTAGRTASRTPIERAGQADLGMRAVESGGGLREQLGAVLVLSPKPGTDPAVLGRVLAERAAGVPRLRQRLVRPPFGAGRPIWLDDPDFDPGRHVRYVACPQPGDEQALLDVAVGVACEPLAPDRPLWRAVLVTGLAGGEVGLVFVTHHAVLDGIGGLAVLAVLADGTGPAPVAEVSPRPRPSYVRLVADAWASRVRGMAGLPALRHALRRPLTAAGGVHPAAVPRCSLLSPTGPRRRLAVARGDLGPLRSAGHRAGGTVNDALLVAVAGALHALLEHRGESVDPLTLAVIVSARRSAEVTRLGNATLPLPVLVPGAGDPQERLRRIAGLVRSARPAVAGPSLMALMGPVFRLLAALGVLRWYLAHQRRVHSLVSNVPGPPAPFAIGGAPVRAIVPVAVGNAGNMTVNFLALSYAGTLTVTVTADPDAVPDLPVLAAALQEQLDALSGVSGRGATPA